MSTMKFCSRCNNVLYPKEDKELSILLYACRYCNFEERANSNIVYRNKIHHSRKNVAADPTLPLENEDADPTLPLKNAAADPTLPLENVDADPTLPLKNAAADPTIPPKNVAADPTLPRTKSVRCSQCNHGEAVFYQAKAKGEEGMVLIFVCCNPTCYYDWRD